MRDRFLEFVPGLLAGTLGGFVGYLLVAYLVSHSGIWVPIVPGAFSGLACGQVSLMTSRRRGVAMAIITLGLVVYAQWKLWTPPFEYDSTLGDYVRHLHQLPPLTLVVFAANVALGYWWGREQGISFAGRSAGPVPKPRFKDPVE